MAVYEGYDQYGNKIIFQERTSFVDAAMAAFSRPATKRDAGARAKEKCPHCQTSMKKGASVCTGCGAKRSVVFTGFLALILFLIYMGSFIGIFLGFFSVSMGEPSAFISLILSVAIFILISFARKSKKLKTRVRYTGK